MAANDTRPGRGLHCASGGLVRGLSGGGRRRIVTLKTCLRRMAGRKGPSSQSMLIQPERGSLDGDGLAQATWANQKLRLSSSS